MDLASQPLRESSDGTFDVCEIEREFSQSDFQKALGSNVNFRPVYRGNASSRPLQLCLIQSEAPSDRLNLHRRVTHLDKAQVLHLHLLREEWERETSERTCNSSTHVIYMIMCVARTQI